MYSLNCEICNSDNQSLVMLENTPMSVLSKCSVKRVLLAQVCRHCYSTRMPMPLIKNSPTARSIFLSMYWSRKARIVSSLSSVPETKKFIGLKKTLSLTNYLL